MTKEEEGEEKEGEVEENEVPVELMASSPIISWRQEVITVKVEW